MWYGLAPVLNGRLRALARLGVLAVALACVAVAVPGGRADDPAQLRASVSGLVSAEREALLRLYAAESATARAEGRARGLDARVRALDAQLARSRRYQAIARASLAHSQARVARVLRALYMDGPPADAIALILGAGSLDDVLDVVDSLRFAADRNRDLAAQAADRTRALQRATTRLRSRAASLRTSRDAAAAAVRELDLVAADRARYVTALRERRELTERRLAAVQAEAEAAARRAATIQAASAPPVTTAPEVPDGTPDAAGPEQGASPQPPPAEADPAAPAAADADVAAGTRTLVVRSTAYSLQGTTASGLPVGPGIIAVDPSVIPLGTRVYVPGYGEAVAADTGSAVQGAIIDVWLPSYEAAVDWGVKTVTITIYRS